LSGGSKASWRLSQIASWRFGRIRVTFAAIGSADHVAMVSMTVKKILDRTA